MHQETAQLISRMLTRLPGDIQLSFLNESPFFQMISNDPLIRK